MRNYIEIPLTQGKFALIDKVDFELVSQHKWFAVKMGNYWRSTSNRKRKLGGKKAIIYMHRLIMNPPKRLMIDHINGNGLDNRRSNLRICTTAENQHNQHARQGGSSRYKGVDWKKRNKKWQVRISVNCKHIHLGLFDNEIEAAHVYDQAAVKYHGEFANINYKKR